VGYGARPHMVFRLLTAPTCVGLLSGSVRGHLTRVGVKHGYLGLAGCRTRRAGGSRRSGNGCRYGRGNGRGYGRFLTACLGTGFGSVRVLFGTRHAKQHNGTEQDGIGKDPCDTASALGLSLCFHCMTIPFVNASPKHCASGECRFSATLWIVCTARNQIAKEKFEKLKGVLEFWCSVLNWDVLFHYVVTKNDSWRRKMIILDTIATLCYNACGFCFEWEVSACKL
jgi:hypothetical protein